jgi:DNA-binding GntR family transcriptional regulator
VDQAYEVILRCAMRRRRGLTVTPVDPQFFEAIYQFRSAVEPLAVRLATPRLTKQAIAQGRSSSCR